MEVSEIVMNGSYDGFNGADFENYGADVGIDNADVGINGESFRINGGDDGTNSADVESRVQMMNSMAPSGPLIKHQHH